MTNPADADKRSREDQALDLAESLLEDLELSRLPLDKIILKTARFARLAENCALTEWMKMKYEVQGYPNNAQLEKWLQATRRIRPEEHGGTNYAPGFKSPVHRFTNV